MDKKGHFISEKKTCHGHSCRVIFYRNKYKEQSILNAADSFSI